MAQPARNQARPLRQERSLDGGVLRDEMCDPILSGTRTFRKIRYDPIFKTGKHKRKVNPEPLSEYCQELAHMTREEQDSLLQTMGWSYHQRSAKPKRKGPRRGVPQVDSLWPGQGVTCIICEKRMHVMGDYLKCRNAFGRYGEHCWNHLQLPVELVRTCVLRWLADVVEGTPAVRMVFIDLLWEIFDKTTQGSGRYVEAYRQQERLQRRTLAWAAALVTLRRSSADRTWSSTRVDDA